MLELRKTKVEIDYKASRKTESNNLNSESYKVWIRTQVRLSQSSGKVQSTVPLIFQSISNITRQETLRQAQRPHAYYLGLSALSLVHSFSQKFDQVFASHRLYTPDPNLLVRLGMINQRERHFTSHYLPVVSFLCSPLKTIRITDFKGLKRQ